MKKTFCLKHFLIYTSVVDTRYRTLNFEYLREFSLKFEKAQIGPRGSRKLIHEENLKSKISCQAPFRKVFKKN
jgi:hypothetical protein